MAGTPKSLSINGTKFALPNDVTPSVTPGGRVITETEPYSDGTGKPVESIVLGKITGLVVDTSDGQFATLEDLAKKKDLSIVYESATKTYELTGVIVASDGITNDTTRDKTSEFEIHSTKGPIRHS